MSASRHVANGVFVTLAAVLAVLLLGAFGAFRTARGSRRFETYIEESAQGLSSGSAVRFRGVPVGTVESIGFVWGTYAPPPTEEGLQQGRYTRSVFTVRREFLPEGQDGSPTVADLVEKGLRVNVRSQGITGLRYLDLDVVSEAARNRLLPVSWTPDLDYIPAAPSIGKTFSALLEKAASQLSDVDFAVAASNLASLVSNANASAISMRTTFDEEAPVFDRTMHSLRHATTALDELATRLRDDPSALFRRSDDE